MQVKDIHVALSQLDSENDEHWTLDGAPRLDSVMGLSRETVSAAAPFFSRTHRQLPDMEALKAAAELAQKEAELAAERAEDAKRIAREKTAAYDALGKTIKDSHALTRANQLWIESQNKVQLERVERQRHFDAMVKDAGGPRAIGRHPIEVNEANRIKAKRKNFTLAPGK